MYMCQIIENNLLDTCYLPKAKLSGERVRNFDGPETLEACQEECRKEFECTVFSYKPSTKTCELKKSWAKTKVKYDEDSYITGWQGCKFSQDSSNTL